MFQTPNKSVAFRLIASAVNICFIFSFIIPARSIAQSTADLGMPVPGSMISLSSAYVPVIAKGLRVHPENPILFDFIIDTGNSNLNAQDQDLKKESEKLIKYFLASLTTPENDLWVNLSPYEKDRIIPDQLGQTEMGRDMLAQDYILKQLTASLIYPEKELGKEFWAKVYAKAQAQFGSSEIPVNTFNKVWIVADKAKVYVHTNTAFVVSSHLKVMLEEDYLSMTKHEQTGVSKVTNNVGSQIVRDIVLPELEKEVNQGKNFANLRQIFNSMILATWYKKNLKEALLNQVYTNKNKVNGITLEDKTIKEQIYQQYLKAYKKGVFNYIKDDIQANGQTMPKKYFSGGVIGKIDLAMTTDSNDPGVRELATGAEGKMVAVKAATPGWKDQAAAQEIREMFESYARGENPSEPTTDKAMVLSSSQRSEIMRILNHDYKGGITENRLNQIADAARNKNQDYVIREIVAEIKRNGQRTTYAAIENKLRFVGDKAMTADEKQAITDLIAFFQKPPGESNKIARTPAIRAIFEKVGFKTLLINEDINFVDLESPVSNFWFSDAPYGVGKVLDYLRALLATADEAMTSDEKQAITDLIAFFEKSAEQSKKAVQDGRAIKIARTPAVRAIFQEAGFKALLKEQKINFEGDSAAPVDNYWVSEAPKGVAKAIEYLRGMLSGADAAMTVSDITDLSPEDLAKALNIELPDAIYYSALLQKYAAKSPDPIMGKNNIPSALLDQKLQERLLGVVSARTVLADPENLKAAGSAYVLYMQLKGGLGTSFIRKRTLERLTGRTTLADKGTDSFLEAVPVDGFDSNGSAKVFSENINVGELKLLNYIYQVLEGHLKGVAVQELVNEESLQPVQNFWNTIYLNDRVDDRIPQAQKRTYRQIFETTPGLEFIKDFVIQGILPVINAQTKEVINVPEINAPGGHAAFVALTMNKNSLDQTDHSNPHLTVFTNGDGVNNKIPPEVAGYMVRNRIPIAMITTTKQMLDMKGGLVGLISATDLPQSIQSKILAGDVLSDADMKEVGALSPYLLELAQAKAVKQTGMFQNMGITIGGEGMQMFNTNVHVQNHDVLDSFLKDLRKAIGDKKFFEIIAPDLIVNPKMKKVAGVETDVIQLEGASGSALLAMNRFIMTSQDPEVLRIKKEHGIDRLVYFINFEPEIRSMVFTPEKYVWDHYLYAFTDLFNVNTKTGQLEFTPAPGRTGLPGLELDKYYEDLENCIIAFGRDISAKFLDYLAIKGTVLMTNAILKGGVFIKNKSGKEVDLNSLKSQFGEENGRLVLDNVFITIDENGAVTSKPVTSVLAAINDFESDKAMATSIDDSEIQDKALVAEKANPILERAPTPTGGIDLNEKNLDLQINGQTISIKFDTKMIEQFKRGDFSGVRPVILNITPISNMLPLLGLAREEENEKLAKA